MDSQKQPLESTTRTFKTTKGTLTYAELSDLIAPKLLQLLDDIADEKYRNHQINEDMIQAFHQHIVGDLMPNIAGKWRNVPVMVGNWLPPEPYEIPIKMHEYVQNLQARLTNANTIDSQIEALAYAEGEFLHIHPFQDFNGRTIRALLDELIGRLNLPQINTAVERDTIKFKQYQNALAEYDNGRMDSLVNFWRERFGN